MTRTRRHLRFARIALAAVAAIVWMAGTASACASKATDSCCASRSAASCCCEPAAVATPAVAPSPVVVLPSPCECRAGDPTPAAPKPSSAATDRSGERARAEAVDPIAVVRPSTAFARPASTDGPPAAVPLFLRDSRLRF